MNKKGERKWRWPSRKIKIWYRVFFKKVLHKREEKMQEKMKMTSQKDENLVQVQQQCSVYFCIKTFFKSWFVWLIWPFECLILMILTMTKYHENLLRDSPLSLLFIVKILSSLETKVVLKIPNETFLRITRYIHSIWFAESENVRRSRTQKTTWRHDGRTPSPTMRQGSSEESDQEETQLQRVISNSS